MPAGVSFAPCAHVFEGLGPALLTELSAESLEAQAFTLPLPLRRQPQPLIRSTGADAQASYHGGLGCLGASGVGVARQGQPSKCRSSTYLSMPPRNLGSMAGTI